MADFVPGLLVKAPSAKAPDYVKCKLSIKVAELAAWLAEQTDEWVNFEVKVSKNGQWYAQIDDWKPTPREDAPQRQKPAHAVSDDDSPF